MAKSGITSGQADLLVRYPPSRGIYWPRVILLQVRLTFAQPLGQAYLCSDVPHRGIKWPRVVLFRLIFGQPLGQTDLWSHIPPVQASCGLGVLIQVILTFGQMYPLVEASSGQEWYYFRSD